MAATIKIATATNKLGSHLTTSVKKIANCFAPKISTEAKRKTIATIHFNIAPIKPAGSTFTSAFCKASLHPAVSKSLLNLIFFNSPATKLHTPQAKTQPITKTITAAKRLGINPKKPCQRS
jgi:hypothetical protein